MKQRLALLGLVVFALLACKKFEEEKEQKSLDQYRSNFIKGCIKGDDTDSPFPSAEKNRICGCIADAYMKGKRFDDLVAEEEADASSSFVKPAVEACKFVAKGRAWAVRVPPPKPLELYTAETKIPQADPGSEELNDAIDLRESKQFDLAEAAFKTLVAASPKDAEFAFQHYVNLSFMGRTDEALDALESAYKLGFNEYPTIRYIFLPGAVAFSTRYEKTLAGLRDRYNTTPPPIGTPYAFIPKGKPPKNGFPVLVVLHAYASNHGNWVEFSKDWKKRGVVVIALPGSLPLGKNRLCWHVGTFEATHDAIQAALKSDLVSNVIDPKRVIVVGYGQGAQHAVGVVTEHSEAYSAVFAIAPGGPPEPLGDKLALETPAKPRMVVVTGSEAESAPRSYRFQRLAAGAGWPVVLLEQPGKDSFPEEYPQNGVAIMDYLLGKAESIKGSPKLKPVTPSAAP
ncbi:MAG: hypothetical protein H6718_21275 [Polyangiaceae bacterium]|nr:hypothetical protein [Myxococcales bacterium]MCB9587951.1 hypothetical protein [Polyangiaceae bacterium]